MTIDKKLDDKVAVITGGSSGIGLATARLFKTHGAHVVLIGRGSAALEQARIELGDETLALSADVANVDDIERALADVQHAFGQIDVLFASAGLSACPSLTATDAAFFDHMVGVNLKGVFFSCVRALPLFRQGASVILTATATHDRGRPGDALYLATKAAVRSLARSLAVDEDFLQRGVRVNVVSPGAIETPLTAAAHQTPQIRSYVENMIPLARWGQPEDVAKLALFLASTDSSYVTGGDFRVDGGLSL